MLIGNPLCIYGRERVRIFLRFGVENMECARSESSDVIFSRMRPPSLGRVARHTLDADIVHGTTVCADGCMCAASTYYTDVDVDVRTRTCVYESMYGSGYAYEW